MPTRSAPVERLPHLEVTQLLRRVRVGHVQQLTHVFLALLLLARRRRCRRRVCGSGGGAATRRPVVRRTGAVFGLLDADEVALVAQQNRFDGVVQTERGLFGGWIPRG